MSKYLLYHLLPNRAAQGSEGCERVTGDLVSVSQPLLLRRSLTVEWEETVHNSSFHPGSLPKIDRYALDRLEEKHQGATKA